MPVNKPLNGIATIGPVKTLEKIAHAYEEKAAVIRHAIDLFLEHRGARKHKTVPATLEAAIGIERARSHHKKRGRPMNAGYGSRAKLLERRKATLEYLEQFSTDTPIHPAPSTRGGVRVGPLLVHGYLKKRGRKGYVRTAKPFEAERHPRAK